MNEKHLKSKIDLCLTLLSPTEPLHGGVLPHLRPRVGPQLRVEARQAVRGRRLRRRQRLHYDRDAGKFGFLQFDALFIQDDTSSWSKPPVDIDLKVAF